MARRLKADRRSGRAVAARADGAGRRAAAAVPLPRARRVSRRRRAVRSARHLPLAAEPYAAAVDVVMECAAAGFTRRALVALVAVAALPFRGRRRRGGPRRDRRTRRHAGRRSDTSAASIAWRRSPRPAAAPRGRPFAPRSARRALLAPLAESRPLVDHVERAAGVSRSPRSAAARQRPARPRSRRRDAGAVGSRRGLSAPRSRRLRHGHRPVGRRPPLARRPDLCACAPARAACRSSTRSRRASPTSTMCR